MVQLDCNISLFFIKQKSKVFLSSVLMATLTTGCWEVSEVNQVKKNTSVNQSEHLAENDKNINKQTSKDKSEQDPQPSKATPKLDKETQEVINLQKTPAVPKIFVPEGGQPIQYDSSSWDKNNEEFKKLKLTTVGSTPEEISKVVSIDENSLDFASHSAIKYRFMNSNAPYFDLVDSNNYLEIGWYYANPSDSDEEKKTSIDHAKKAHKFSRQIMGAMGGELVVNMLAGKITHNKNINGVDVALAKCQFYSCMLALKKPKQTDLPTNVAINIADSDQNSEVIFESGDTEKNKMDN